MTKPNSFWQNWSKTKGTSYAKRHNSSRFINFSGGENSFGTPSGITNELKNIRSKDINKFPDANCTKVKKKIAEILKISENMISVGNGSDELIENISRIFIERSDKFLIIVPTFFRFAEACLKAGGIPIFVETADSKFKFDKKVINETLREIKKEQPKIIWICSPNNPTGEFMSMSNINKIIKISKGLVVVDEAYSEFIENFHSATKNISKFENLIVIKTLSKGFGLAGIRFGFAITNPNIAQILEGWRLPFNVNSVTQKLALKAFDKTAHLKFVNRELTRERKWLFSEIRKLKNFELGGNSKTNLFLLRHKKKDIFEELLKQRIFAGDFREQEGIEAMKFVRINVKERKENKILLTALKNINL